MIIIAISFSFFVAEIAASHVKVGFYTHSLALIADAFHYVCQMNDLIGFIVALVALKISERPQSPDSLSFGWQRSPLLGAFFNGVFLLALGVSIFLQAIERFVSLQRVENPKLVLVVGCIGLALNIISASFLHESHEHHRHIDFPNKAANGHDLGLMGVLIHVIGDAINNVGVIIAALVIWLARYEGRFYADPGVSVGIALIILVSAAPL
ncbi:hypothetical protein LTR28_008249, partial [Elasticomyces elasticus]